MFSNNIKLFVFVVCVSIILSGCAAPAPKATSTSIPPTLIPQPDLVVNPGLIIGSVNIGGVSFYIKCKGQGNPTVILDSGPEDSNYFWSDAQEEISKYTTVCVYDRLGIGKSSPVPEGVRTTKDMVKDLSLLLTNASIPSPYVLVSFGNSNYTSQVFTNQFPNDVAGLVFVEGNNPNWLDEFCVPLPTPSAGENPDWEFWRYVCLWEDPTSDHNSEHFDIYASSGQVKATGSLGDIPLAVLVSEDNFTGEPGSPKALYGDYYQKAQQEQAALSTQGKYQIIIGTDYTTIANSQDTWNVIIDMVKSLQAK